ncbi:MAG TPA: hypothetical protein VF533_02485 [Solirubrobacteraceae bacterium]|jgi:hypothetical protein
MSTPLRFILPAAVLIAVAALVAAVAGTGYAVVALLIGLVIIGGLAAGYGVAQADDAPFATSPDTPAGDTPEHSDVSSAVSHSPH